MGSAAWGGFRGLHVGSGPARIEGWINLDLFPIRGVDVVGDASRGLPVRDVPCIYCEHFLEHLDPESALRFFAAARAALVPGGVLRLSTPNLDYVVAAYERASHETRQRPSAALRLNRGFYGWGHRLLWNRELLAEALTASGFERLSWHAWGQSERAELAHLERHEASPDEPHLPHVLIVEAVRGVADPARAEALRALVDAELRAAIGVLSSDHGELPAWRERAQQLERRLEAQREELLAARQELLAARGRAEELGDVVETMRASRFWKLRDLWWAARRRFSRHPRSRP